MGVKVREKIKGSGVWWVFVSHGYKRASKRIGSKKAAAEVAGKIAREIALERFQINAPKESPAVKFRDYAEQWMAGHVQRNLKESTFRTYRILLDQHIFPTFGNHSLREITRNEIKTLCYEKGNSGLSGGSVRAIARTLSAIFNNAIEDGIVTTNPAARPGRYVKMENRRDKISFLIAEEVTLLLKTAKKELPRFYPFLLTALRTGMRKGELIGLQWGDIDWLGKFIEVRRSYSFGHMTTPKNGKTRRVDMSDQLVAILRTLKAEVAEETLAGGKSFGELVFPSEAGTPRDPSHVVREFNRALKKAGLRHIRFHDLRHTNASLLLQNGESPVYVKEQMGHHSIQITVDTYGHLIPGANRQAVNRLDDPMFDTQRAIQSEPSASAGS